MTTIGGKRRGKFWVGFAEGKLDLYRDENYYNGVLHADLFTSKKAAKKCYKDVRLVEVKVKHERGA